jgi:hypothetical protein
VHLQFGPDRESALTGMDVVRWPLDAKRFLSDKLPDRGARGLDVQGKWLVGQKFPRHIYASPVTYWPNSAGVWRRFRAALAGVSVGPTHATGRRADAVEAELAIQREFYETKFNERV